MPADLVLQCAGVGVRYGEVVAAHGIDLAVAPGELLALLGPSGSGKSTLLHAVAGLLRPCTGTITISGRVMSSVDHDVPPERRNVGLVFQDFALWPHLSALDTVAYPLRRAGRRRSQARSAAREILDRLDIGELSERRPGQLSGGQQQRVGLARALARDPLLFLLDEPTAHLDPHLRTAFSDLVRERIGGGVAAAIYATHDATEALAVADRVAVLRAGRVVQIDSPERVYAEPADEHVAALTGAYTVLPGPDGGERLMVRPEWISAGGPCRSAITRVAFRGAHTDYVLDHRGSAVVARLPGLPTHRVGDTFSWGLDRSWRLPADDPADAGQVTRAQ